MSSTLMAISQCLFKKTIPLYHSTSTIPLMAKTGRRRINRPNLISAHMKGYNYLYGLEPIEIPPEKEPQLSPPSPGPPNPLWPDHDPLGPDMPEIFPPGGPDVVPPTEPEIVPPGGPEVVPPTEPEIFPPGGPDVVPPTEPEIVPPGWPDVTPPTPPEIVPPGGPDVVPPKRQEPEPWKVPQPDVPSPIIFVQ